MKARKYFFLFLFVLSLGVASAVSFTRAQMKYCTTLDEVRQTCDSSPTNCTCDVIIIG